jgi:competence protein ComEC
MQAGFQLSYLAVLGIVAFQKKIYSIWTTSWWLTDKTWSLIVVSIAAQMGTFPLSIGLFGFIPTWFLAANLIVIPLSAIIIYLGVALLILSSLPLIPGLLATSLNWCLRLLNSSVEWIQSWPASIIRPVYMTRYEELCCYLIILGVFLFINKKMKTALIMATLAAIMWTSLLISRRYEQYSRSQMSIYNIPGGFAIDFFVDKKCFCICDSALSKNNAKVDRFAGPNRTANGIRQIEKIVPGENFTSVSKGFYTEGPFIFFSGKNIVLIDEHWRPGCNPPQVKLDYVILYENPKINIEGLMKLFDPEFVIISSANSRFLSDKWLTQCREMNISCHSIPDSGAFVIKCN